MDRENTVKAGRVVMFKVDLWLGEIWQSFWTKIKEPVKMEKSSHQR